jgi:polyribonucleotide 5'-hydroxyl-kinase
MIRDIVAEFCVSVIVVLGHERLYNDMVRRYGHKPGLSVVKLGRSGGAVELPESYLLQQQSYSTKQYFYGELKNVLSPVSRTMDFKTVKVYRIAEGMRFQCGKLNLTRQRRDTCISSPDRGRRRECWS